MTNESVLTVLDERGQEPNSRRTRQARVFRFLMLRLEGVVRAALYLRASNEHILIVRVLRARRTPGRSFLSPSRWIRRYEHKDFETLICVIHHAMLFPGRR